MFRLLICVVSLIINFYIYNQTFKRLCVAQNPFVIEQFKYADMRVLHIKDSRVEDDIKVYRKYGKLRRLTKLKNRFFKKIDTNVLTNVSPNAMLRLKRVNALMLKNVFKMYNVSKFFSVSSNSFKINIACKNARDVLNKPIKLATVFKQLFENSFDFFDESVVVDNGAACTYTVDLFTYTKRIVFINLTCCAYNMGYVAYFFNKQLLQLFNKNRIIFFNNIKYFGVEKVHDNTLVKFDTAITQKQARAVQRINFINYLDACINPISAKTLIAAKTQYMFLIDDFKELFYARPEFKLFKPIDHIKFKHWRLLWRKRSIFFKHPIFYDFFFMGTHFSSFRQYFVEALQWSTNNETHIDVFKEYFIDSMINFLTFTRKNVFIKRGYKSDLNSLMCSKNKQLVGGLFLIGKQHNALKPYNQYSGLNPLKVYKHGICCIAANRFKNITAVSGMKKKKMCQFNKIVLKSRILCKDR